MAWLDGIFSTDGFMPHGHCYLWEPHILWLHVVSDALIGFSYFSIPVVLMVFSAKRGDLKLNAIFYAFSAFILACGLTHFLSIATIWNPFYMQEGLAKGATALISATVAAGLWLILPKLVALPSPARLAAANAKLNEEIVLRRGMEEEVRARNSELVTTNRQLAMRDYALAHAAGALLITDTSADIVYCNDGFATLLGLHEDCSELVGQDARNFLENGADVLMRVVEEGRWTGEITLRPLHGEPRIAAVAANLVDYRDGSPPQIIASMLDVTEQRQAEQALRLSQARLANAQRIAKLGNAEWNIVDNHFTCSDEIYEVLDIPRDIRLSMEHLLSFIHPEDQPRVRSALNRSIAAPDQPLSEEYRVVHPDGNLRVIHAQAEVAFDADGTALSMTGTLQDVTERKKAETANQRTQAFLDLIVENIPAMLFVKDARDLRFITMNQAGEALLGISREELIGKADTDLFPPEQAEDFIKADLEVLAGRTAIIIPEEPIDTRAKGRRLLRTVKVPVYDEEDRPLYLLGFSTDITDQKQLEQQFRQAQKMETVGHLTGGVAHDFNNVLMAMQLNMEVAQDFVKGEPEAEEALAVALNAVQRGADLTSRLLSFSRRQPLRPAVINANSLIGDMMRLLHRTLKEDLDVETVLAAGLWAIEVDPAQLENALINLAVNARDAMPGGGKLTIETANTRLDEEYADRFEEVTPGQYVMIAVSDTGTGMAPEVIERAFDPFFTTKEVGKGSGLGLSMVYGFVKQSGGHLNIYSEPDEGTTIKLYFPRSLLNPAEDKPVIGPKTTGGRENLLLVEDDPNVRKSIQRSLEGFGYSVMTAASGPEAVALIDDGFAPDLLLVDVVLPGGMSGPQAAAAVREKLPRCKVVYMSGYTDNAIIHHGRLDPGVRLISKPFTREALAAKLRKALDS